MRRRPPVEATETPTTTSAPTDTTSTPSFGRVIWRWASGITAFGTPDPIGAGQRLRYTMVATNRGPATAENVIVTQTLPSAMRFISATLAPDRRAPALVWSLGSLGDDETRVLDVEVWSIDGPRASSR